MKMNEKWVVITGASSGIGKALAFEFANGGFNLLLTGRDELRLVEIANECSRKHQVATQVIASDLSTAEGLDNLIATLSDQPNRYEVLVNNAGFSIHGKFGSSDIEETHKLLNVQITASVRLTHALLPAMVARGSGRILNVASVYSFSPVPFQSIYSASKAFLFSFSESLRVELQGTGVTVTAFCPGTTQTELRVRAGIAERNKTSGMTAAAVARIAYVGTLRGSHLVVPGLINRFFVCLIRHLPVGTVPSLVRVINQWRGQNQK